MDSAQNSLLDDPDVDDVFQCVGGIRMRVDIGLDFRRELVNEGSVILHRPLKSRWGRSQMPCQMPRACDLRELVQGTAGGSQRTHVERTDYWDCANGLPRTWVG
jgi:hypothetical protein